MHIGNARFWKIWGTYLLVFVFGIIFFAGLQRLWIAKQVCISEFDLLNPAIVCESKQEAVSEWDYEPLRQKLVQRIGDYTAPNGTIPHIALYFRDLKRGARLSIRENEIFEPASLIKLPIMMAILHEADRRPELLDEVLTYQKEDSYRFITGSPDNMLKLHSSYTVRELLQKMIQYSDNSSATLLQEKINVLGLQENSNTFADLGTMQLVLSGELDNTRLISLVNIFVVLYNAHYLSRPSSQFALELLSSTNFDQGIVGGVPKNIRVAHKYGMRIGETTKDNELHDCGIVFHPSAPYILCVLTAGADFETSSPAINEISSIVYKHIDQLNP